MRRGLLAGLFLMACALGQAQSIDIKEAPIFEAMAKGRLNRGVYATYEDFLRNTPSDTSKIYIKREPREAQVWKGTYTAEPRYAEKNKKVRNVWGFSDGKKAYISHQIEFFEIKIEDDSFIFEGYQLIQGYDDGDAGGAAAGAAVGVVIGGGIGGAIGGAIGSAGGGNKVFTSEKKAKKQKIKYRIHSLYGVALHPDLVYRRAHISTPRDVVFYRRDKKAVEQSIDFVIDDSLGYSFPQNASVRLRFNALKDSINICLGPDYQNCLKVGLIRDETRYVKLQYIEKEKGPNLKVVEASEGEFDSYKARKKQKKIGEPQPKFVY